MDALLGGEVLLFDPEDNAPTIPTDGDVPASASAGDIPEETFGAARAANFDPVRLRYRRMCLGFQVRAHTHKQSRAHTPSRTHTHMHQHTHAHTHTHANTHTHKHTQRASYLYEGLALDADDRAEKAKAATPGTSLPHIPLLLPHEARQVR